MGGTPGESSCKKMSKSLVTGRGREEEIWLIKNVSGDDDVVGGEIKTLIAFVIGGVSEENTSRVDRGASL
jgi:hypothetical protein